MSDHFKSKTLFTVAGTILLVTTLATPAKADFVATSSLSGLNERPSPNSSPGMGFAVITFNALADTIMYDVTYSNLQANALVSHIHVGSINVAGPVVLPFSPSPTGISGEITGTLHNVDITNQGITGLTDVSQIAAQIQAGNSYVNLHTSLFPGGEIRGQLAVVTPEPGSLLLLGVGFVGLIARRAF